VYTRSQCYPYILAGVGLGATFLLIAGAVAITGVKPANFTELVAIVGSFTGFIGTLIGTLVGIKVGGAAGEKAAKTLAGQINANAEALHNTQALLTNEHAENVRKSDLLERALGALPPGDADTIKQASIAAMGG